MDERYISPGLVRLAFVNNPLPMHRNANMLATAAICAGEQSRYWDMHDRLFEDKPRESQGVLSIADSLGLEMDRFGSCLESSTTARERVGMDVDTAQRLKLSGTPAFAVGRSDEAGNVTVLKFISGAQPSSVFDLALGELLEK